ncbi:hypothetical protein [Rhizorhabdus dicambivorans]|uniref:hypothetical protein n=1 Tax=Rhizorhabdus dicambivorans TaxID=1850238 RepID=UPI000834A8AD|nr:hypothetical protein [Rhizorhabdus dicambivorans]
MRANRIKLTDDVVRRLPLADSGSYIVRDSEVTNFFVLVGKRRKSYCVQQDTIVGDHRKTVRVRVGSAPQVSASEARTKARKALVGISDSKITSAADKRAVDRGEDPVEARKDGVTLWEAWERFKIALERKSRSPRTISGYETHLNRYFADWKQTSIKVLSNDPDMVARRHDRLTEENGPYGANGAMRTLRAIYNHARKKDRSLPVGNPVDAVDWNREHRRKTGMGPRQLPQWFDELVALENPVRREFHLFSALSGCRPGALKCSALEHINWHRRLLHIPMPKGGADRAFDIVLSPAMIRCLIRTIRISRRLYPEQAETWIFAAASKSGHIEETQEDRSILSKWGNDLRQTFRTCAQAARVPSLDAKILMNHALPGVNEEYITVSVIMSDHLRRQQEKISDLMLNAVANGPGERRNETLAWLSSGRTDAGMVDLERPTARDHVANKPGVPTRSAQGDDTILWLYADEQSPLAA